MIMDSTTEIPGCTMESEVFKSYAFWAGILALKMVFLTIWTGLQRFRTGTVANTEDVRFKYFNLKFDDDRVERPRRAHRNDLECVLPYLIIGYLYTLTNPDVVLALWLYRVAAIARIIHTLVYVVVIVPQPARGISFWGTNGILIYMAIAVTSHFA